MYQLGNGEAASELAAQPGEAMLGALGSGLIAMPASFRAGAQGLERCCERALLGYHSETHLRLAAARCLAHLPRASGVAHANVLLVARLVFAAEGGWGAEEGCCANMCGLVFAWGGVGVLQVGGGSVASGEFSGFMSI